jgi:hypothetical protein
VARNYVLNLERPGSRLRIRKVYNQAPEEGYPHGHAGAGEAAGVGEEGRRGFRPTFTSSIRPSLAAANSGKTSKPSPTGSTPGPKDDPALARIDRVNFPQAREQARAWRDEVNKNPWLHIKDKPARPQSLR